MARLVDDTTSFVRLLYKIVHVTSSLAIRWRGYVGIGQTTRGTHGGYCNVRPVLISLFVHVGTGNGTGGPGFVADGPQPSVSARSRTSRRRTAIGPFMFQQPIPCSPDAGDVIRDDSFLLLCKEYCSDGIDAEVQLHGVPSWPQHTKDAVYACGNRGQIAQPA